MLVEGKMDAKQLAKGVSIICLFSCLSGCVDISEGTVKTFENIEFESDVVELDNAYLNFIKDDDEYGDVRSVELRYILHNPQERSVSVQVYVTFYDKHENELHTDAPYIINLPKGYTESDRKYAGSPAISLEGSLAKFVDHVKIFAYEVET